MMKTQSAGKAGEPLSASSLPLYERLAQVTRALSSVIELEPYLGQAIAATGQMTGSQAVFVLELDQTTQSLRCIAATPTQPPGIAGQEIALDATMAGRAIQTQSPIRISHAAAESSALGRADPAFAADVRSMLAVPLMVRGKALGALLVVNKTETDYTEEDATIVETLAASIALAMDDAALRHRAEQGFSELADLDRMKSDFIAITSHELRTPLGLILGHATFLRELVGQQYRDQLDVIIRNATRLKEIIDSLASMDNYGTGGARVRRQAFSLNGLIREVIEAYAESASKRGTVLNAALGSDQLLVEADRTKISIALGNLVRNAIAFTDAGGHVVVQSEPLAGYAKVSVIDDGIGIPMKDLPRIFERFFQVESHLTRHHGGMGLGLSVAKAMIEMHDGRIWVESLEGKGSNFSFLLPRKAAAMGSNSDTQA
jgi:signal transduction histidine kinase